jgi:phospholipase/carboxylesterase
MARLRFSLFLVALFVVLRPALAEAQSNAKPTLKEGEIDSVRFVEMTTGGAGATEALPLVVALHPQGEAPSDFADFFAGLAARARVVLPFADARNGEWSWYRGNSTDPGAPGVRRAARRLSGFLPKLVEARATAGRPVVVGYSQGAIVALALAVTDSNTIADVLAIAGRVPPALFPEARRAAPGPVVEAFHGEADRTVPFAACRQSIAVLRQAGFDAKLTSYRNVGHEIVADEAADFAAALVRAVERSAAASAAAR